MSEPQHIRTFYRIVWTNPPTSIDFKSHAALGKVHPDASPEHVRVSSGLSVYRTESQARRKARGLPWKGNAFIAEINVPVDQDVRIERTLKASGHFTLWTDEHIIEQWVVRVVPV